MILRRDEVRNDYFYITKQDTLTKQQLVDREDFIRTKTHSIRFVAQDEMENCAAYILEDEDGDCHLVGYTFYCREKMADLLLPPIVYPKPTMTLEEALVVMVKFAPINLELMKKEEAFTLPKDFVIAREVLGGREAGMEVFRAICQIFKTRI